MEDNRNYEEEFENEDFDTDEEFYYYEDYNSDSKGGWVKVGLTLLGAAAAVGIGYGIAKGKDTKAKINEKRDQKAIKRLEAKGFVVKQPEVVEVIEENETEVVEETKPAETKPNNKKK